MERCGSVAAAGDPQPRSDTDAADGPRAQFRSPVPPSSSSAGVPAPARPAEDAWSRYSATRRGSRYGPPYQRLNELTETCGTSRRTAEPGRQPRYITISHRCGRSRCDRHRQSGVYAGSQSTADAVGTETGIFRHRASSVSPVGPRRHRRTRPRPGRSLGHQVRSRLHRRRSGHRRGVHLSPPRRHRGEWPGGVRNVAARGTGGTVARDDSAGRADPGPATGFGGRPGLRGRERDAAGAG